MDSTLPTIVPCAMKSTDINNEILQLEDMKFSARPLSSESANSDADDHRGSYFINN